MSSLSPEIGFRSPLAPPTHQRMIESSPVRAECPDSVFDERGGEHALTFIYGRAGETWGWMVKDWLDERP